MVQKTLSVNISESPIYPITGRILYYSWHVCLTLSHCIISSFYLSFSVSLSRALSLSVCLSLSLSSISSFSLSLSLARTLSLSLSLSLFFSFCFFGALLYLWFKNYESMKSKNENWINLLLYQIVQICMNKYKYSTLFM